MVPKARIFLIVFSSLALLSTSVAPVFAAMYNPGVSIGQYVKYGNFVGVGGGEAYDQYDWTKLEVVQISEKEVWLLSTGLLKNGAPAPEDGITDVWNVESGTLNGIQTNQGPIIAANLNQGDLIPPNIYTLNKTEERTYLGEVRVVNIHELSLSTNQHSSSVTYVYDRSSGMLLELLREETTFLPSPSTSKFSFSVIDSNIFSLTPTETSTAVPKTSTGTPDSNAPSPTAQSSVTPTAEPTATPTEDTFALGDYAYVAIAVIAVAAVIAAAYLYMKRKK